MDWNCRSSRCRPVSLVFQIRDESNRLIPISLLLNKWGCVRCEQERRGECWWQLAEPRRMPDLLNTQGRHKVTLAQPVPPPPPPSPRCPDSTGGFLVAALSSPPAPTLINASLRSRRLSTRYHRRLERCSHAEEPGSSSRRL